MASLGGCTLFRTEPSIARFAVASLLVFAGCPVGESAETAGGPLLAASVASDSAGAFYVSPSGSPGGDGSVTSPWHLQTALDHPAAVQPGDTIWLRGGTYSGMYASRLTGTAAKPIIVRQYPGERATIDGGSDAYALVTFGSHTWFWGFGVMGSAGHPILPKTSVGNRFINLVVHDGSLSGIGSFTWNDARAQEIHGCIVYNNGHEYNLDHGLYVNSDGATGTFAITDNIVFNNWARGIQVYAKEDPRGEALSGFVIEGNVAFHNGSISVPVNHGKQILVGGMVPASEIVVRDNYSYRNDAAPRHPDKLAFSVGHLWGPANDDVVVENNYIVGGLYIGKWASALIRGNLVYGYAGPMVVTDSNVTGHTWDSNRFYGDRTAPNWMHVPNGPTGFATWKAQTRFPNPGGYVGSGVSPSHGGVHSTKSGVSASRTIVSPNGNVGAANRPVVRAAPPNHVVLRRNKYEAGRANIIVYNWERQSTVSVDVSGVLDVGDRYVVQNVQDFYGPPVAGGTYDGGPLALPMAGVTPPVPTGKTYTPAPATGPTFNVFVLMKAS